jgi:ubiquinone/menaquinone biosynthesis C-methylase UbiE
MPWGGFVPEDGFLPLTRINPRPVAVGFLFFPGGRPPQGENMTPSPQSTTPERYTPGPTPHAAGFMAARTLESHGRFALPWLKPGMQVLDLGCGPGTITLGLADTAFPGTVTGLDTEEIAVRRAQQLAEGLEAVNASFRTGSAYRLPFADETFDFVFSHALFEHLSRPLEALAEIRRVLRPAGFAALCSPDWDQFEVAPWTEQTEAAFAAYRDLQTRNGGDTRAGSRLGDALERSGFLLAHEEARLETYADASHIAEYLARQLEAAGDLRAARAWRRWSGNPDAVFHHAWISAVGVKG